MAPTGKEIRDEIAKLRELQKQVPPDTMFGDSNTAAIDAEIEVLEEDLTEDDIDDRSQKYEDDETEDAWPLRVRDMAVRVRQWLDGQEPDPPSRGWEGLVKTKENEKKEKQ